MKKTWSYANLITLLFMLSIGFIACHKDDPPAPTAKFTVSTQSTSKGTAITFNNKSSNASNFLWKFGDGNGAVTKNPVYAYDSIGNFTATLIALGTGGIDSTTISITVSSGNITILDGEGIKDVNLNTTWGTIKTTFGITDSTFTQYYYSSSNYYDNIVSYNNLGIAFVFYSTTSTLLTSDPAYVISVYGYFEGTTKKGIALWDPISYAISYYGTGYQKYTESEYTGYVYYQSGVAFYSSSDGIFEIDVFTPSSGSSTSLSGMMTKAATHIYRRNFMLTNKNVRRK
jgi:PKD repeat protein